MEIPNRIKAVFFPKNKKIYLSGAITGNPKHEKQFENAERILKENCKNISIINPLKINNGINSYEDCIKHDIGALINCDYLVTVNNYHKSKGSLLEIKIAQTIGMLIFKEKTSIRDFTTYMSMKK